MGMVVYLLFTKGTRMMMSSRNLVWDWRKRDLSISHKVYSIVDYSANISVYGLKENNLLRLWPVDSTR